MMTIELSTSLRHMIDARLDNIERALMTKGTPRGDRRQILSAIEDQILEMLGQTAGDEPSRDDVLSTLAKLDPPEAYLELTDSELPSFASTSSADRRSQPQTTNPFNTQSDLNTLAIISFVLTCFAGVGVFTWWFLGFYGMVPLAIVTIAAGICGTIAMCQFIRHRRSQRGLWMAITASSCAPAIAFYRWSRCSLWTHGNQGTLSCSSLSLFNSHIDANRTHRNTTIPIA